MASRVYAVANQKGGVGKTTTAVNLAACLAEAGERALVIDLDPQANATSGLGMRANGTSSYDLLDGAPLDSLARHTRFDNLDLVPAKPELAGAVVLWLGASADLGTAGRVSTLLGGDLPELRDGLVVVRKLAPTPARFPRRAGMAKKRPLS